MSRIADRYGLDRVKMNAQYQKLCAFARRRWKSCKDNKEAWRLAVAGAEARRQDVNEIKEVISKWLACTGSSCGVERVFSTQMRVVGPTVESWWSRPSETSW